MDTQQLQHNQELLRASRLRLQALETRAAQYGIDTPAEVQVEIDELRQAIAGLEGQLAPPQQGGIPPVVADFVGREDELGSIIAAITEALGRGDGAVASLVGLGGVGKTQLALAAAERLKALFPDAQYLLRLRGAGKQPLSPEQALQTLIRACDPASQLPQDLDALRAHYAAALGGKKALILADDARDLAQVKLLQPPPGCALLITSRQRFTLPGLAAFDIETLPPAHAAQLLLAICPRIGEGAPRLAELCGRLPLALRVSASLLASDDTRDVTRYLERLSDERERLAQLCDPDDPELNVEASLQLSYDALDSAEQRTLRQLSVFHAGFDLPAAAAVTELAEERAEDVLGTLRRGSLLAWDALLKRYMLQDLVRAFAAARQDPNERDAARQQHTNYYLRMVEQADAEIGGARCKTWLNCLEQNHNNIRTALERALGGADNSVCLRLVGALCMFWEIRGYLSEGRQWLDRALAAPAPNPTSAAQALRAKALCGAGVLAQRQGDYARATALLEEGLALFRALEDNRGVGKTLTNMGWVALDQSDYARASGLLNQALALYRALEDKRGIASVLTTLGWVSLLKQQDYGEATPLFEEGLALYREAEDRDGTAAVLVNLAWVAVMQGDTAQAAARCRESLQLSQELGDREGMMECLMALADVAKLQGQFERAVRLWASAENIYTVLGVARSLAEDANYKRSLAAVRSQLPETTFATAWSGGYAMAQEQVIAELLRVAC